MRRGLALGYTRLSPYRRQEFLIHFQNIPCTFLLRIVYPKYSYYELLQLNEASNHGWEGAGRLSFSRLSGEASLSNR